MRNRFGAVLALFALAASLVLAVAGPEEGRAQGERTVVTTFYPMYVFTQNVAAGAQGVRVVNMAGQDVGCLHDYQLRTQDMVLLEEADALVINGGGMERFLDRAIALRGELSVIDASEGIDMLCDDHEHGDGHDHEHGENEIYNAHVWLDPALACAQVENIARGLSQVDPDNAALYAANAQAYIRQLEQLDGELRAQLAPLAGREIVTFHEAFAYFARAYGLRIAGTIEHEPGEQPGTREMADTCDLVTQLGLTALFVEPQYPQNAAQTIARETGARVFALDPGVTGDGAADSYEQTMRQNARILLEALNP